MNQQNGCTDTLSADWMISKIHQYLAIRDLQSLRAVNTSLKAAMDSFIDNLPGHFQTSIGFRLFCEVASFLPISDLCKLSTVSRGCRFAMRSYSTSLPFYVRALISTWNKKNQSALLMYSTECFQEQTDSILYHPAFFKISLGPLAYDQDLLKLVGQPLEEVQANNAPPPNLGRLKPFVCSTNHPESDIFYCGGAMFVEGHHDDQWISSMNLNMNFSSTTALFDVATGLWRELPPMPEARMGGVACTVGRKVLIIGGSTALQFVLALFGINLTMLGNFIHFILVFDLEEERWNHVIHYAPGEQNRCDAAVALDNENVIIVSGVRVFSLNVTSGQWTELPPLQPSMLQQIGDIVSCQIIRHRRLRGPLLVVCGKITYAVTIIWPPGRTHRPGQPEWLVEPDMRDHGIPKMIRFHSNSIQFYSGYDWETAETEDIMQPLFYQGRINEGTITGFLLGLAQFSLP